MKPEPKPSCGVFGASIAVVGHAPRRTCGTPPGPAVVAACRRRGAGCLALTGLGPRLDADHGRQHLLDDVAVRRRVPWGDAWHGRGRAAVLPRSQGPATKLASRTDNQSQTDDGPDHRVIARKTSFDQSMSRRSRGQERSSLETIGKRLGRSVRTQRVGTRCRDRSGEPQVSPFYHTQRPAGRWADDRATKIRRARRLAAHIP